MKTFLRLTYVAASLALVFGMAGTLAVLGGYYYVRPSLPDVETLREVKLEVPLRVYTRDGRLLSQFGERRRTPVSFEEIPERVIQAFLAAEDDRFFEHPGVDYQGLLRASISLLLTGGERRQGGSTITMQVARNFYLDREKLYSRKLREIFLALRIERELSKNEILTLYLNKIFLGHRAYGVGAAAEVYFGKPLEELDLSQIATIAGIPQAPSVANPVSNLERAKKRRAYVLRRMRELDYIDDESYREALTAPLMSKEHGPTADVQADYLAELVRSEMIALYGLDVYTAGYKVTTTLDSRLQTAATDALRRALLDYDTRHGYRGPVAEVPWPMEIEGGVEVAWTEVLDDYREVGPLRLGLAIKVDEEGVTVFMRETGLVTLDWEGMSWAKRYIDENTQSEAPEKPEDVVKPGHVINLALDENNRWRLTQVPEVQGALVAIDPWDGAIIALEGGFDYSASKYNRAVQAKRQPGSSFKPFVYSAALESGLTTASIINDAPVVFESAELEDIWRPENYTKSFSGPTRLREALVRSLNLVSVRILRKVGIGFAVRYIQRFGFSRSSLPADLSLALGSAAVTPVDMASAYATFANGGHRTAPYYIQRIEGENGTVLFEASPPVACRSCAELEPPPGRKEEAEKLSQIDLATLPKRITNGPLYALDRRGEVVDEFERGPLAPLAISRQNAYIVTDMMHDVIRRGTGVRANQLGRRDLSGKTGTTNDRRDAWFSGFNGRLVATAWVGFDQERSLGRREEGGKTALPMWMYFMAEALSEVAESPQEKPSGLVTVKISPDTGELAPASDMSGIFEIFLEDNVPTLAPLESGFASPVRQEEDEGELF